MKRHFAIWEVGVYKTRIVYADSVIRAVRQFAGTEVLPLKDWQGYAYTNPLRYIASDGSAREFHVREQEDN